MVLLMLTGYVSYINEVCSCYVGIETIADDTELSTDTVRKRLAWLETVGAIARFPRWIDPSGRVNSEGLGRRTSDDIRLLIEADQEAIEARASGSFDEHSKHDSDGADPRSQQGQQTENKTDGPPVSPTPAPCRPSDSGKGLTTEPESKPEPSSLPSEDGGSSDASADEQSEAADDHNVEGWQEFKSAFEADGIPIIRVSIAKTLFSALTTEHRHRVAHAAKGLIAYRAREKKPGTKPSAQTFIREIDAWAAFEKLAPAAPITRIKIQRGSEAFSAATVFKMLIDRTVFTGDEIEIREELATSSDFLALARFAGDDGSVDRSRWLSLDPHNPTDKAKVGAWRERIKTWSGRWVEFEKVSELDAQGQPIISIQTHNGMELKFPKLREALLVPLDWPPAKGGGTGPPKQPNTLMTEDDAEQFSKTG
jgi:hypothetical protein